MINQIERKIELGKQLGINQLVQKGHRDYWYSYAVQEGVINFVSLLFCLIPEAGCGQSPQALINTGFPNISGK